jgi:predicted TIM-barrel fold metal-dependent hydrolase
LEAKVIIDSHVHLVGKGWIDRSYFLGCARMIGAAFGKATGEHGDPEYLADGILDSLTDTTGENLIATMDAAGIDRSCVFALDYGLCAGEPEVSMEEQNRLISEAVRRCPDRLIAFFTVDPRRREGLDLFKRAVEDWGMRGLKLHPPYYEQCREYGIPVLFHTGSQPAPMKWRFAQPIYIDDVAADFPELPIIMAHVAGQMWEEALMVASVKPNVYFDVSGWQAPSLSGLDKFYRMLRSVLDEVGPWRVFFGSDGPYYNGLFPLEQWVKALTEPDLSACPDITFSPEEREIVAGKAFARLIDLA